MGLGFRKDGSSSVPFLAGISTSFSMLLLPKSPELPSRPGMSLPFQLLQPP